MAKMLNFPRINNLVISGRLTREIDLRYTPSGSAVASIPIAFDRAYKNQAGEWQSETSYINVIVWNQKAEQCASSLKKGNAVIVEGYLKTRTYTDSNNQNRKITEIVANKVHFLEREDNQYAQDSAPLPKEELVETTKDDDVPF